MKTFDDKADEAVTEFWDGTGAVSSGDKELLKIIIKHALQEQDRDTRHACAQNVLDVVDDESPDVVRSNAHNACMNTKGG